jgi:hypothetical protein
MMLGIPIEYWALIERIKPAPGSMENAYPFPYGGLASGIRAELIRWVARVNTWKSMNIAPDTPMDMIYALGDWPKVDDVTHSWHRLNHVFLMHTQADRIVRPYTHQEQALLTWV